MMSDRMFSQKSQKWIVRVVLIQVALTITFLLWAIVEFNQLAQGNRDLLFTICQSQEAHRLSNQGDHNVLLEREGLRPRAVSRDKCQEALERKTP